MIFTKIHAKNTLYEITPNNFVGKGKLSDTDELPNIPSGYLKNS